MNQKQSIRLLFLSDSHLGFDMPMRNGTGKRRRGDDFFRVFDEALKPAMNGDMDLVLHGGDLFFRSRIPVWLTREVLKRIQELSKRGVPFCFVPGNHERSQIAHPILWGMEHVHVFEEPKTVVLTIRGITLSISAFPFFRGNIRTQFRKVLANTGHHGNTADIRILCMHQIVEGACVGPVGFQFNGGPQVIRGADVPHQFAAIFAGHIHRHQILQMQTESNDYPCTVVYAGSTERTSFAERDETKGYIMAELGSSGDGRGEVRHISFRPVRTRRMYVRRVCMQRYPRTIHPELIASLFNGVEEYAILRIEVLISIENKEAFDLLRKKIRSRCPRDVIIDIRRRYE